MPIDPITGSAIAAKVLCTTAAALPLKMAAVSSHSAAVAATTAMPPPEVTTFAPTGPPEITSTMPLVQIDTASRPIVTAPITIPPTPTMTIPSDVLANIEGLVNAIRLPEPTSFAPSTPGGTYHEFPGPVDVRTLPHTGHVGSGGGGEVRTLSDIGMQDVVDRANDLNRQLHDNPSQGIPTKLYQDVYDEIVRRLPAFRGYDPTPQIRAAIVDNITNAPEITPLPVESSGIHEMIIPLLNAMSANCCELCRRPERQGASSSSSSSSSFLDIEDTSFLRRLWDQTYMGYADAWIGVPSAIHEIMA
ncbi:hypothetical protein FOL47_000080 [Perkinsus chesapeaki]|uniref:Uncharacterized protein n=1 Tax=Perkinsus chesapeaki TaxID=330153 RepID=A0A7J6N627_PERCH|nr:hypothetical protein FOL47_000080 [Perkinsus chesapeaki]